MLQHLNPQLKLLIKYEDFATAAPFLFWPSFGEVTKEQLEAAALIQKTQTKVTQNFQKRHTQKQSYWGHQSGSRGNSGPSRKGNSCTQFLKCAKSKYNTSGSCSIPWGVSEQHELYSLPISHKESILSQTELGNRDTGQLGPANSTGVSNYPCSTPVMSASPNSPA